MINKIRDIDTKQLKKINLYLIERRIEKLKKSKKKQKY